MQKSGRNREIKVNLHFNEKGRDLQKIMENNFNDLPLNKQSP